MTKMKLSEAIRKGAAWHPQVFGDFFEYDADTGSIVTGSCALGAAYLVVSMFDPHAPLPDGREDPASLLARSFPHMWRREWCPVPQCPSAAVRHDLFGLLAHLNDDCLWTRERIADWLDQECGL